MIHTILILTGCLLALLGLTELIHGIKLLIFRQTKYNRTFSVVYLNNKAPEGQLNYMIEQSLWHGRQYADYIIAVSDELDEENYKACKAICDRNNVVLCPVEAVQSVIKCLS